MRSKSDIRGHKYGMLTVTEFSHRDDRGALLWVCICGCGKSCVVRSGNLRSGHTTSCGCRKIACCTAHGKHRSPEYTAWDSMLQRCKDNPAKKRYADYAGRGITVCERWGSFDNFYADMGDRPSDKHSLDRIDNNGNYCLENCRWATTDEQANNRRVTIRIEYEGRTLTLLQWSALLGIPPTTLRNRLKKGLPTKDVLSTKPRSILRLSTMW